jgi:hypothetical protein
MNHFSALKSLLGAGAVDVGFYVRRETREEFRTAGDLETEGIAALGHCVFGFFSVT